MATSAQLVARVRANINEPVSNDDPQRSDEEIAQWLQDALLDYIQKIPADGVSELITNATFTGSYWEITSDFLRLLHVVVNHTMSGTTGTLIEQAYVHDVDEVYLQLYTPVSFGAWARFEKGSSQHIITTGPDVFAGTITYLGLPPSISSCNATFPLDMEHEEPIVNYATHQALAKINDEDALRYMERYNERVAAENQRYPRPWVVEKESK